MSCAIVMAIVEVAVAAMIKTASAPLWICPIGEVFTLYNAVVFFTTDWCQLFFFLLLFSCSFLFFSFLFNLSCSVRFFSLSFFELVINIPFHRMMNNTHHHHLFVVVVERTWVAAVDNNLLVVVLVDSSLLVVVLDRTPVEVLVGSN